MTPHQDGTFLYNEPLRLFGFWFPIGAEINIGFIWSHLPYLRILEFKKSRKIGVADSCLGLDLLILFLV